MENNTNTENNMMKKTSLSYEKEKGVYKCGCCGEGLFKHDKDFNSIDADGNMPNIDEAIEGAVKEKEIMSEGENKKKAFCTNCDSEIEKN